MSNKNKLAVDVMAIHPEVTGSCNLVIVHLPDGEKVRFIVDCGLFQEKPYDSMNNNLHQFNPEKYEFAILTHNHIDHSGRLPLLFKKGFTGKIYTTKATGKLLGPALNNTSKILSDVGKKDNLPALYTDSDVGKTLCNVEECEFDTTVTINRNVKATFFINGHLIGAALVLIQVSYPGCEDINLLFTGDYNSKNLFFDVPQLPDWVKKLPISIIQESTYGNTDSTVLSETVEFSTNVIETIKKGGTAILLAFSLGRTQEILYKLKSMQICGLISTDIPIYLDGNLSIKYTELYKNADLGIKPEMLEFIPYNFQYVDKQLRPQLLCSHNSKIIVTSSGMGTYGPAQVYIPGYIENPKALIQFNGYVADGTLGRRLKEAEENDIVFVNGMMKPKKARVEYSTEFSAHARADEMINFLNSFHNLRTVLINHGQTETKQIFAGRVLKCTRARNVGILSGDYLFRLDTYGFVKSMTTHFM